MSHKQLDRDEAVAMLRSLYGPLLEAVKGTTQFESLQHGLQQQEAILTNLAEAIAEKVEALAKDDELGASQAQGMIFKLSILSLFGMGNLAKIEGRIIRERPELALSRMGAE